MESPFRDDMTEKKLQGMAIFSFSLIELVSVIGFVGVGLTGVLSLLSVSLEVGNQAVEKSSAIVAADHFLQYNIAELKNSLSLSLLDAFPNSKPMKDDLNFKNHPDFGWSNSSFFENDYVRFRFLTEDRNEAFNPAAHYTGYYLVEQLRDGKVDSTKSLRSWKKYEEDPDTRSRRVVIYVEISYPAEKPYPKRKRFIFSEEFFKKPPPIPINPL